MTGIAIARYMWSTRTSYVEPHGYPIVDGSQFPTVGDQPRTEIPDMNGLALPTPFDDWRLMFVSGPDGPTMLALVAGVGPDGDLAASIPMGSVAELTHPVLDALPLSAGDFRLRPA